MPARGGAEPGDACRLGIVEPGHLDREADAEHEAEEKVELAGEQHLAQPGHDRVEQPRRISGTTNIEWLKAGMFM